MQRVVILQEYVPDYRVTFFRELAARCESQGILLSVHAGRPSTEHALRNDTARTDPSIPIRQRQYRVLGRRITLRSTRHAVKGADVVVIEQARRNLDAYRILLPRWLRPGTRVAMWGHGRDFVTQRSRLETELSHSLTRRVDHFFAYTASGARHVENVGLPSSRITVVRNSTDVRTFEEELSATPDDAVGRFRRQHGLTSKTLLYVGGLDASKRLDLLFKGFEVAQRIDPELALLIAGDGPHRPQVEAFADRTERVVFAGRLSGPEKALAFRASSALAIPGRVGLVAVDSIASGLPILTTDWEYHAPEFEYLESGKTAFVSSQSPDSYARLLVDLMRSPSRLAESSRLLRRESPNFGVEVMADNFLAGLVSMTPGGADNE